MQQRASLIGEYTWPFAAAGEFEDDGERGAVSAAGNECPGVTVREDAGAAAEVAQQIGAEIGHRGTRGAVFGVDGAGFGKECFI